MTDIDIRAFTPHSLNNLVFVRTQTRDSSQDYIIKNFQQKVNKINGKNPGKSLAGDAKNLHKRGICGQEVIFSLAPFSSQGRIIFFSTFRICKTFFLKNIFFINYFLFSYDYAII